MMLRDLGDKNYYVFQPESSFLSPRLAEASVWFWFWGSGKVLSLNKGVKE